MRSEILNASLRPENYPRVLDPIPPGLVAGLLEVGGDIPAPSEKIAGVLHPNAHNVVEYVLSHLQGQNPAMLDKLVKIVTIFNRINNDEPDVSQKSELFLAGMILAHEVLQQTQSAKVRQLTPEAVGRLLHLLQQKLAAKIILKQARVMMKVDGNENITTLAMDTFLLVKGSALEEIRNLRSAFAQGFNFMYWLWYTQANQTQKKS